MNVKQAILLIGGLGTRLRPFTYKTPKPLLPIVDKPLIAHQVARLKRCGIRDVILAVGNRASLFRRLLGDGSRWGVRFIYSIEKEPLGTGGAIRLAARHVRGPALIMNGDVLDDLDVGRLIRFHGVRRAEATLALVSVPDTSAFGVVETARDGRVLSFIEKPAPGRSKADTISAGCYLFDPGLFDEIPEDRAVSVEREVFPRLLGSGRRLFGFLHKGFWTDVGTLESYLDAHAAFLGRFSKYRPAGRKAGRGLWLAPGARMDSSAVLRGQAYLGPGCRVEAGAVLAGFVSAGEDCVIGEKAVVSDSVLHAGSRVGAGARVDGSILGEKVRVGSGTHVGPGMAVAPASISGENSRTFGLISGSDAPGAASFASGLISGSDAPGAASFASGL